MSDNVDVTEGSGKTIATDDVGGVQYQRVKIDVGGDGAASPLVRGQQTTANSLPITLPSDQTAVPVKAGGYKVTVSITRPSDTNAYAALDVIGDTGGSAILTFASAGPSSSYLRINAGRVGYNVAALPSGMTGLRLHLFNASPTAIADNAAFNLPSGDRSKYLGFIDLGAPIDLGDTLVAEQGQQNKQVLLVGGSAIYGLLQTLTAFTPGSADTFDITLMGEDL